MAATFAEHLHSTFRVHHDGAAIALDLVAVADGSTPRQVTFTLLFRGPSRPVLAQQIYPFEHDRLGRFDLFIVPVGQDAQGLAYEVVFNRLIDERVTFRPIAAADTEFLYRVYASTRTEELAVVDWPEAQKDAFLRAQFDAQHRAYQGTYRDADFLVILRGDQAIGRLYLARGEREIRVVDIALLPECRNTGLGTAILTDILAEAAQGGKRVSVHVEMFNPAQRLYQRLGFRATAEHGVYHLMEWTSASG